MSSRQVLVIDDENSVRKIICDNLRLSGFEVEGASSGDAGLEMIDANPPGVVITDMIMPGKSGLEVVGELRRRHPAVKIIAISGGGRVKEADDMLERATALGADVTMAKPLDLDELEKIILKLLG